jgi:hypothetical protein
VPSAVRIETLGRGAAFSEGFGADKSAAPFSGQTSNLEYTRGVSDGWVQMDRSFGMHEFASLCG